MPLADHFTAKRRAQHHHINVLIHRLNRVWSRAHPCRPDPTGIPGINTTRHNPSPPAQVPAARALAGDRLHGPRPLFPPACRDGLDKRPGLCSTSAANHACLNCRVPEWLTLVRQVAVPCEVGRSLLVDCCLLEQPGSAVELAHNYGPLTARASTIHTADRCFSPEATGGQYGIGCQDLRINSLPSRGLECSPAENPLSRRPQSPPPSPQLSAKRVMLLRSSASTEQSFV